MGRRPSRGMCTTILTLSAFTFPTLQRAGVDPGQLARRLYSSTVALRLENTLGDHLAIFHEDHSSSSRLWKIACSCFDSTNNAAVSTRALSLRRRSRSSSLIRLSESRAY